MSPLVGFAVGFVAGSTVRPHAEPDSLGDFHTGSAPANGPTPGPVRIRVGGFSAAGLARGAAAADEWVRRRPRAKLAEWRPGLDVHARHHDRRGGELVRAQRLRLH
jgi:hypothetical protein